jgi:hypothetical protein
MYDGFHASEVYMAEIIRRMVKNSPSSGLLKKVNIGILSSRIQHASLPLAFELPRMRR